MPGDRQYMYQALELAQRGRGMTSPNPMVGCVIVRDGAIVGRGYHLEYGALHAEAVALADAGPRARGAAIYLTLEPCCHDGPEKKTPPCAPALIKAGLKRAIVAMADPNPLVAGRGIAMLRDAGVETELGVMEREAAQLNAPYISLMTRARPWLTAKWAMSLDGKIAAASGDSKWISSGDSRKLVHYERAASGAVMAGIGTVLADDPLLTTREGGPRQPLRVIVDSGLKLPPASRLAQTARESPVLVYASARAAESGARRTLENLGVEVAALEPGDSGHLPWQAMLADLGERRIASVLLEGGGGLFASAFSQKAVDAAMIFIAPVLIGGSRAPLAGYGAATLADALHLEDVATRNIGPDLLILGRVTYPATEG